MEYIALSAIMTAATATGAKLPQKVAAALAHLQDLAQFPSEVDTSTEALHLAGHLGDPKAWAAARDEAVRRLAFREAGRELDAAAQAEAEVVASSIVYEQRDAIATAYAAALAPTLARLAAAAAALPADVRPEQIASLTPDQYAAYREVEVLAPELAPVTKALTPLLPAGVNLDQVPARASEWLLWWNPDAVRSASKLLDAMEGRRAKRTGMYGTPNTVSIVPWGAFVATGAQLELATPTEYERRVQVVKRLIASTKRIA